MPDVLPTKPRKKSGGSWLAWIGVFLLLTFYSHSLYAQHQIRGLKLADGFGVTKVASNDIASNIYSLSVSPRGEVFVTGPGYIKILLDEDEDGVFDSTRLFSSKPKSGAQGGLEFDGDDVYCTGDGAVLKFTDANRDGVADGIPTELFKIKTGGEHDAHSVRKGPDGWWYVLAGNGVPILPEYHAGPNSPVKKPRAGFLMRVSPDWKTKEVFCHGFRNAYDFDFNSIGDVFVYDSDGERDVNLPWYCPTRVFKMRAGDDAGWVDRGWKRPSHYPDMPIEVGALGRGSPTGVVVNSSPHLPPAFHDAVFVADWTFGRVVAFKKKADGKYDRGSDFAVATGQFGFAVSDLDFDDDGSLLVSVGGRGTEGAVYRIFYQGDESLLSASPLTVAQQYLKKTKSSRLPINELLDGLNHTGKAQRIAAAEALVGREELDFRKRLLSDNQVDRFISGAALFFEDCSNKDLFLGHRMIRHMPRPYVQHLVGPEFSLRSKAAGLLVFFEYENFDESIILGMTSGLGDATEMTLEDQLQVYCRVCQLVAGDCGRPKTDQMFIGYTAGKKPAYSSSGMKDKIAADLVKALKGATQTNNRLMAKEVGRCAAMFELDSESLIDELSQQLTRQVLSVPDDIHWLNCLAQACSSSGFPNDDVRSRIAQTLVALNQKLKLQNRVPDRNFYPRLGTLVKKLFSKDKDLAKLVASKLGGQPNDAFLFNALPKELRGEAINAFATFAKQNPNEVSVGLLEILSRDPSDSYSELIRSFQSRAELKNALVGILSRKPLDSDRELFLSGLNSSDLSSVKNSAIGLRRVFKKPDSKEMALILKALRRLGWDKPSISVRDQLMLLLEKHAGSSFDYEPKAENKNLVATNAFAAWFEMNHPKQFAQIANQGEAGKSVLAKLKNVNWSNGDKLRGADVYKKFQCAQCHDGGTRLGPQLGGVSKRFGREDLFRAIVLPNSQVPERYRAFVIETVDGLIYRGSKVYDSVDGITLQQTDGRTVRINSADIESRSLSSMSLMPEGLLDKATESELADLYAYLSEL